MRSANPIDKLDVVDRLDAIHNLLQCAWMASASLNSEECNAMQVVLSEAQERIRALADDIDKEDMGATA